MSAAPTHLLLIEDNPGDARLLQERLLEQGLAGQLVLSHVERLEQALIVLKQGNHQAVLLSLRGAQEVEAVQQVRQVFPEVPIIVLTGRDDEEMTARARQGGAQGCLVKSEVTGHVLVWAVRYAIERKRAEMAERKLLGILSHDLRNPLQVISSAVSLLKMEATSERQIGHLEKMKRAVKQANRLIQDLLDVTRIEAGGFAVAPAAHALASLLNEAIEQFRPLALEQGLTLEADLPANACTVLADRARVNQVLGNLLGNALKFTPKGGRISIRAVCTTEEAVVSVADNGCGIHPEHLPHLFEQFWQADPHRRKGAGLGLAIVKGIMGAHRGRVWAESELGRGTTFFFTLPLVAPRPAGVTA